MIYDQIGQDFWTGEGVTSKQFRADVAALGDVETIDVRINSVGGSVFEGIAIYNTLKQHKATINVHIDGMALSMASGIAEAGDKVTMAKNGLFMLHNPQSVAMGDSEDMTRAAKQLETTKNALIVAYADKSGKSNEEVGALMDAETWLTAQEALDHGFIDAISGESSSVVNSALPDVYRVPTRHAMALANFVRSLPMSKEETKGGASNTATPEASPANNAPKPATMAELKSMDGANSDFVVAALENSWTVQQAQNELLKISNAQIAELRNQLAKNQKQSPGQVGNDGESLGVDPLKNSGKAPEKTQSRPMGRVEVVNQLHQLINEKKAQLGPAFNLQNAMLDIQRERPELFPNSSVL